MMYRAHPTASARLLTALCALGASCAHASGFDASFGGIDASFSGYGTAGGTFTSNGKYSYVHGSTEFTGASNSLDVGLDSRIGVQAVVTFDPQWSVTAQEEAKLRGNKSFDPGTEWLFVQYQPVSDLKFRLGRVVMPAFLYSDVINVGYAVPWFHAPNELYDALPFDYIDGVQIQWQHNFGSVRVGAELTYGNNSATLGLAGLQVDLQAKNTVNGAIWLNWGDLLVRYAQTDLRTALNINLGPALQINSTLRDYFHCYGLQYDNGRALLMSEWIRRDESNLAPFNRPIALEHGWYLAGGWHFGKLMPLLTYSTINLTESLFTAPQSVHSWGASLRYDVVQNLDLKMQINRTQANNSTYFLVPQGTQDQVYVYSLGADFVF